MAVTFAPRRGAILMCDFDMACVVPEMNKVRPVLVVSRTNLNHRQGLAPGVCQIVPFTTKAPKTVTHRPPRGFWEPSSDLLGYPTRMVPP